MNFAYEWIVPGQEKIPAMILHNNLVGSRIFTPQHWHESFEIDYIIEGRIFVQIGNKRKEFTKGDICVVNSKEIHMANYIDLSDQVEVLTIQVPTGFLEYWYPQFPESAIKGSKALEYKEEIVELLNKIDIEHLNKDDFYELKVTTYILELMRLLLESCSSKRDELISPKKEKHMCKIREAISYINSNYKNKLTLNEVAEYLDFVPSYFSKYFKSMVGDNYYTYLQNVRFHHAVKDLEEKKIPILDCALENGFPNVKAFIEMFKKVYGCTPSEYRKRIRLNWSGNPIPNQEVQDHGIEL